MSVYEDQAHLYDIAFSWDVGDEVEWLLMKLGPDVRVIVEPGCGSGRMFPDFVKHGVDVIGVDCSETMLRRAAERMARLDLPKPTTLCADMTDFDLSRTFDGAICPINTFGYLLTRERALAHLECVAHHLPPGRKYLLQVDLADITGWAPPDPSEVEPWVEEDHGTEVKAYWGPGSFDPDTRIEVQRSRLEVLSGPDTGCIFEEDHPTRRWDWEDWRSLIESSPFRQTAAYDGSKDRRPRVALDQTVETVHLAWHELTR